MPLPSSSMRTCAVATLVALAAFAAPSPVQAQLRTTTPRTGSIELTPFGGYNWGGTFETDASGSFEEGKLREASTFSWGVILSKLQGYGTAGEIFYLRQDADVSFEPRDGSKRDVGKLSNNYIQIGGRRHLQMTEGLSPFISASLGTNILDSDAGDAAWRFAFSLGGGVTFPFKNNPRIGLRIDSRWMVTLVPSGDLESWCSVWSCYTAEGTAWLNQGQASAGLSIKF